MPCQRDASLDGVSASPVCFRGETATLAVEFRLSRYDTSRRLERHQSPVRLDRGDWCGCRLRGGSGCAHTPTRFSRTTRDRTGEGFPRAHCSRLPYTHRYAHNTGVESKVQRTDWFLRCRRERATRAVGPDHTELCYDAGSADSAGREAPERNPRAASRSSGLESSEPLVP